MASLLVPVGSLARGSKVDGGLYSLFGALCPYDLRSTEVVLFLIHQRSWRKARREEKDKNVSQGLRLILPHGYAKV